MPDDALSIPPVALYNIEAEQSVLGGLMLSEQAWDQVGYRLQTSDFFRLQHRIIFRAIADLIAIGRTPDAVTVSARLEDSKELQEAGGSAYLGDLLKNTASIANIAAYVDVILERALFRRVWAAHHEAGSDLLNTDLPVQERARRAANRVADAVEAADAGSEVPLMRDVAGEWIQHLEAIYARGGDMVGLATGFADIDKALLGLCPGELVILAARPSMGKTALALNILANVLDAGGSGFMASLEMTRAALFNRLAAASCRINYKAVRQARMDEIGAHLGAFAARLKDWKLAVDDRTSIDMNRLETAMRAHKRRHGLSLGVVDYLQLMRPDGNPQNDNAAVAQLSRDLKNLAGVLDCPLLVLSQLNRSLEKRTDKRPVMSDLRDSGAIEQDANTILFLYRDVVYNEHTPWPEYTELIVGKAREAERGQSIPLYTRLDQMRFANVDWQSLPADWRGEPKPYAPASRGGAKL